MHNHLIPKRNIHPSQIIRHELEERGWNATAFANHSQIHLSTINELLDGRQSITPAIAHKFATAFNVSAQFWLNLQTHYDDRAAEPKKCTRTN